MVESLDAVVGQLRSHGQHCASGLKAAMISHKSDIDRDAIRGSVPGGGSDMGEEHRTQV